MKETLNLVATGGEEQQDVGEYMVLNQLCS